METRERFDRHAEYCWNPRVASRTVDGTAFVLLDSRMVSLNPTATRVWELLKGGSAVNQVAEKIVEEFDTTLEAACRDAAVFIEEMQRRQMVVLQTED